MPNENSFELNRAIQQWRENLGQSPAFRTENLYELETHLRDSVVNLQSRGLSEEEAFTIASRRTGEGRSLETEFRKINSRGVWLDRVLWMLVGIQVWGLTSGLVFSVARNAYAFGWRKINYDAKANGMALPVTLFTLVQLLAFAASIALCWWLIVRKGRKVLGRLAPWLQTRATFIVISIALCVFVLCVNILSNGLSALLFWAYGRETIGQAMLYSNYAQLWVSPFEVMAMIAATLILVRKRLRVRGAISPTC